MKKSTAIAMVTALAFVGLAASATASVLTASPTAPSGPLVKVAHPNTGVPFTNERDLRYRTGGADRDLGQTFTAPENFTAASVTVRISANNANSMQSGVYDQTLTLRFYNVTDATTYDAANFTPNGVYNYTFPSSGSVNIGDYLTFQLDSGIALTSGNVYGFVLQWDTEAANKIVKLHHNGAFTGYSGGVGIEQNFGSGTGDVRPALAFTQLDGTAGRDLTFFVTAIPEPGALAVIGVGLAAMIVRRRLQRR